MAAVSANLPSSRKPHQKSDDWYARQKSRERTKLIGILAVATLILLLVFARFAKTIPWGAR